MATRKGVTPVNAPVPPPVVEPPKATQQSVFSFITGTMKVGRVAKSSRSKTVDPLTVAKDKVVKGIESQKALVKLVVEGKPLPKTKGGDKSVSTWWSKQSDGYWTHLAYGQLPIPIIPAKLDEQLNALRPESNDLTYELTETGEKVLMQQGLWTGPKRTVNSFLHDYMDGLLSVSTEIEATKRGAQYLSQPEILKLEPLAFPVNTEWEGKPLTTAYEPDGIFALGHDKLRYYLRETDRNSEPVFRGGKTLDQVKKKDDPFKSSSIFRKLIQLRQVVRTAAEKYQRPVMVLFITNNHYQMLRVIDVARELGVGNWLLIKCYPQFPEYYHKTFPPIEDILDDWIMVKDGSSFSICT